MQLDSDDPVFHEVAGVHVTKLCQRLGGMSLGRLAGLIDASIEEIAALERERKLLSQEKQLKLDRMNAVVLLLGPTMPGEAVINFLNHPFADLGGMTPLSLLWESEGYCRVCRLVREQRPLILSRMAKINASVQEAQVS